MRMHVGHADTARGPAERLEEAVRGERCPTLTHKYVTHPSRLIAAQFAQCPNFNTTQWLDTIVTALAADYLQSPGLEVDLIPAKSHELTAAKPVPVSH